MNKDQIPDSVNVLGLIYSVDIKDMDDEDGCCIPSRQRIEIREGMSEEKTGQVFIHELVHAILDQLACIDEYQDERLVQGLAVGLHQALYGITSASL